MTALSKEVIFQTAEDFGCMIPSGPDDFEFFFYPLELEAFVKVCRADLVIENERLRILLNHEYGKVNHPCTVAFHELSVDLAKVTEERDAAIERANELVADKERFYRSNERIKAKLATLQTELDKAEDEINCTEASLEAAQCLLPSKYDERFNQGFECLGDFAQALGDAFNDELTTLRMGSVADDVVAGALYDFLGYLTTRRTRITMSDRDEAGPAVDALVDWSKTRKINLDEARVKDWNEFTHPQPSAAPVVRELVGSDEVASAIDADGCERIKDFYSVGPVQRAAVESFAEAVQRVRPVQPLSCPKCHALWLFWPKEQSGFDTDSLSVKSAHHCEFCERADASQLTQLGLSHIPVVTDTDLINRGCRYETELTQHSPFQ